MPIECKALNRWVKDNKDRKNFNDPVTAKEWSELLKDFTVGARHTAANLACHNWDVTIIGERLLMHSHWSKGKWYDKGSNTPTPMTDEEWAVLHHGEKDRYGVPPEPDFQRLAEFLQAREAAAPQQPQQADGERNGGYRTGLTYGDGYKAGLAAALPAPKAAGDTI